MNGYQAPAVIFDPPSPTAIVEIREGSAQTPVYVEVDADEGPEAHDA